MTKEKLLEAAQALPADDVGWLIGKLIPLGFGKALLESAKEDF